MSGFWAFVLGAIWGGTLAGVFLYFWIIRPMAKLLGFHRGANRG